MCAALAGRSAGLYLVNFSRPGGESASRGIYCAVNFGRLGGESASRGFTGAR